MRCDTFHTVIWSPCTPYLTLCVYEVFKEVPLWFFFCFLCEIVNNINCGNVNTYSTTQAVCQGTVNLQLRVGQKIHSIVDW